MKVPAGWRVQSGPQPASFSDPRLVYTARAVVVERELVIVREGQWRRGTTSRDGLGRLDQAITALQRFEQSPVVLVRE
jgi:hypothetical protein